MLTPKCASSSRWLREGVPEDGERSESQPQPAPPGARSAADGDVLMVTSLDRLARSTRDLLNTLATITDSKAGSRSLANDTTTAHGRLVLTVLGGLAEFERELTRARTGEGRARAVARGVTLGRKPKLTPHQQREALTRAQTVSLFEQSCAAMPSTTALYRGCIHD